eukprot:Hpha_TRINITY_DN7690_c0_g1::TRINITY_DN7690_c0_g1_i1::g.19228::m.19228
MMDRGAARGNYTVRSSDSGRLASSGRFGSSTRLTSYAAAAMRNSDSGRLPGAPRSDPTRWPHAGSGTKEEKRRGYQAGSGDWSTSARPISTRIVDTATDLSTPISLPGPPSPANRFSPAPLSASPGGVRQSRLSHPYSTPTPVRQSHLSHPYTPMRQRGDDAVWAVDPATLPVPRASPTVPPSPPSSSGSSVRRYAWDGEGGSPPWSPGGAGAVQLQQREAEHRHEMQRVRAVYEEELRERDNTIRALQGGETRDATELRKHLEKLVRVTRSQLTHIVAEHRTTELRLRVREEECKQLRRLVGPEKPRSPRTGVSRVEQVVEREVCSGTGPPRTPRGPPYARKAHATPIDSARPKSPGKAGRRPPRRSAPRPSTPTWRFG